MHVNIREAQANDSAAILQLVKELAIFEKAENSVKTTEKDYQKGILQNQFYCIVAVIHEEIVGMALFFPYFSTWNGKCLYLEDFIVKAKYRGLGIGKKLFDAYLDKAKSLDVNIAKWQVLDWNTTAIEFYKKYPTEFYKGWDNGVIRIKE